MFSVNLPFSRRSFLKPQEIVTAVAILALAGCTTPVFDPEKATAEGPAAAKVSRWGWKRTRLTYDRHGSGAAKEIRQAARESYLFAQLAQNAYSENEFKLPAYVTEYEDIREVEKLSYAARTYKVAKPGETPYIVIAFRGTTFTQWRDWVYGNLTNAQYEEGLAHVRRIKGKLPGTRVVLAGHSLGGAIATWVSLRETNVEVYGFNASHRISRGDATINVRAFLSQTGEINVLVRRPLRNPGGMYTTINCIGGNPVGRHAMRDLAECLTRIAAWEDKEASASAELNELGPQRKVLK